MVVVFVRSVGYPNLTTLLLFFRAMPLMPCSSRTTSSHHARVSIAYLGM